MYCIYILLKFLFHFLIPAMVPEDSMNNPLCHSAIGSMVTFDYSTPDTFDPISWMCKKQTAVSHSSTESEIISLDTRLRLDGLPALELWDLIVSVFGNISHVSDGTGQPINGKNKSYNKIDVVHDIDLVPSNVQSASREALLYVFEDNEVVIKMIRKAEVLQ